MFSRSVLLTAFFFFASVIPTLAQTAHISSPSASQDAPKPRSAKKLPACPPDVTHLEWSEFIKTPVGSMGLELTEKIKSLDGKKVRLLGYMVRREQAVAGAIWLTPRRVDVEESEAGFADLPPQAVYVTVPYNTNRTISYTSHPLLLTGTLSVGPKGGTGDDATSIFRLALDTPPVKPKTVGKPGVKKTVAPKKLH